MHSRRTAWTSISTTISALSCLSTTRATSTKQRGKMSPSRRLSETIAAAKRGELADLRELARGRHLDNISECFDIYCHHLVSPSNLDPNEPLPPSLGPRARLAFVALVGLHGLLDHLTKDPEIGSAFPPVLTRSWSSMRPWILFFLARAFRKEANSSSSSLNAQTKGTKTELDAEEDLHNEDVFDAIHAIVSFIPLDDPYFKDNAWKDGSHPIVMKLWLRTLHHNASRLHQSRMATQLSDCLRGAQAMADLHAMRFELLQCADGNARHVAELAVRPLRDAVGKQFDVYDLMMITSSFRLIFMLLEGFETHGLDERKLFLEAIFDDPQRNTRLITLNVVCYFSAVCRSATGTLGQIHVMLSEVMGCGFKLFLVLLKYKESLDYLIHLFDHGILDALAHCASIIPVFTDRHLDDLKALLTESFMPFLVHRKVVKAAVRAVTRLQDQRRSDNQLLMQSPIGEAWAQFTDMVLERSAFEANYLVLHPRDDIRRCYNHDCHIARKDHPLQRCAKCKEAMYCSKECQSHDWKFGGHKEQCSRSAKGVAVHNFSVESMHYFRSLATTDVKRHLPGLNALACRNPRLKGGVPVAYSINYRKLPPILSVFPASDFLSEERYIKLGLLSDTSRISNRRESMINAGLLRGEERWIEIFMPGRSGENYMAFTTLPRSDFGAPMNVAPPTYNPKRRRGRDEAGGELAVRKDAIDSIMIEKQNPKGRK